MIKTSVERVLLLRDGSVKLFINGPPAGIEAAISDHFIMLFRDMLYKALNKVHNRKSFFHILVIFVSVVMKGYKVTVIVVNSGGWQ